MAVIVNSKWCGGSVAQFVNDSWVLDLTRPTPAVLTVAETACGNKVLHCIAPKLASKAQLMHLVAWRCPDPLEELTTGTASALVWQRDRPTNRPTDHAPRSATTGRIYVRSTAMRPSINIRLIRAPACRRTSCPRLCLRAKYKYSNSSCVVEHDEWNVYVFSSFYSARNARIASALLATAIPSVCPSVCPSVRHTPVLCQNGGT